METVSFLCYSVLVLTGAECAEIRVDKNAPDNVNIFLERFERIVICENKLIHSHVWSSS